MLFSIPLFGFAQNDYKITSYQEQGTRAPNTHYIGDAWLKGLLQSDQELPYNITKATVSIKLVRSELIQYGRKKK